MGAIGYTKARSMGPVAKAVRDAGGSVVRVFRRAELPLRLIEYPDQIILLRDQLALVECAAREIGDEALAPRLSIEAGFRSLGVLGEQVGSAPTLKDAILRCNSGMETLLQSATHLRLVRTGRLARWTYEISDGAVVGRHRNELLAIGYMTDVLRHFVGSAANASRVELPALPAARTSIQDMLRSALSKGDRAALIFPLEWLDHENPNICPVMYQALEDVPSCDDLAACVAHLVGLSLLDRRPNLAWVARRLGVSGRTLQRRLSAAGANFEAIRAGALRRRASDLLRSSDMTISQIAYELGYADPAHFTRAATQWSGLSPRDWRRELARRV
jgi:AraC-like DNA-binding protein